MLGRVNSGVSPRIPLHESYGHNTFYRFVAIRYEKQILELITELGKYILSPKGVLLAQEHTSSLLENRFIAAVFSEKPPRSVGVFIRLLGPGVPITFRCLSGKSVRGGKLAIRPGFPVGFCQVRESLVVLVNLYIELAFCKTIHHLLQGILQ